MRLAIYRARVFGLETVSLRIILPIALPRIITGISLRSVTNVVAAFVIAATFGPILPACCFTRGSDEVGGTGK